MAATCADIFCFNDTDRKKLVICGISAGFAAVFGTPIAGAIFGIEVLYIGALMYDVLLPSFIAGITSYQISSALGVAYFYHPIDLVPTFSQLYFFEVIVGGIFLGLCCLLFIESIHFCKRIADRIPWWPPMKALAAGIVLVALAYFFSDRYLGLGLETIEATLNGAPVNWWDSVAKILFTSITITFGGSGGLVTPIFFIGSTFGSLYASIIHIDQATFAAIGMVSMLAGAANTPIAASILAMEIFGQKIAPYAAVACVTCFLITGHRSIYPSQITAAMKSASIRGNLGEEIEEVQMEFILRKHTPSSYMASLVKKFLNRSSCRFKK
ncbi:chloride channel protein [Thermodesulfobacteriota bacterium]